MEEHSLDIVCPEFKYEIIGQYGDPLRRQLGEALNILETGNLNRKMEYNGNEICRLESRMRSWEAELNAKKQLDDKKIFNEKIGCFINVMSKIHNSCDMMELTCENSYRLSKRKREMDASTPINNKRRERQLIDVEDESPIGHVSDNSGSSSDSVGIPASMNPTGMSDELTQTHLTPRKSESSSIENRGLYDTAFNLTKAAEVCGVTRRSSSLPDVLRGIEHN